MANHYNTIILGAGQSDLTASTGSARRPTLS